MRPENGGGGASQANREVREEYSRERQEYVKGPEEGGRAWCVGWTQVHEAEAQNGVGVRRALSSAIPPVQATLRFFYSSVITTSRN